jgi:hypothetical protein
MRLGETLGRGCVWGWVRDHVGVSRLGERLSERLAINHIRSGLELTLEEGIYQYTITHSWKNNTCHQVTHTGTNTPSCCLTSKSSVTCILPLSYWDKITVQVETRTSILFPKAFLSKPPLRNHLISDGKATKPCKQPTHQPTHPTQFVHTLWLPTASGLVCNWHSRKPNTITHSWKKKTCQTVTHPGTNTPNCCLTSTSSVTVILPLSY